MCGRYTLFAKPETLKRRFRSEIAEPDEPKLAPRYNIAPAQDVPVITAAEPRAMSFARWGLVPSWAKDVSFAAKAINARAETVREKPSFRSLFKKRRCLIPASGFYEWRQNVKPKQPVFAALRSGEPFAFAGLWDEWRNPAEPDAPPLRTCAIITTEANECLAPFHGRMAVILAPEEEDVWLDEAATPELLAALLKPYPAEAMTARAVSARVNNARSEGASLLDFLPETP